MTGTEQSDNLVGTEQAETLDGRGGDDEIFGFGGDDILLGGTGNDLLRGGLGDDTLDGGEGIDVVEYYNLDNGVTVDLSIQGPQDTGWGIDTILNVENVTGTIFADVLRGSDRDEGFNGRGGADSIFALGGNDTVYGHYVSGIMDGGAGIDTLYYSSALQGVEVNLATTSAQFIGPGISQTVIGFEHLFGSQFNDKFGGTEDANTLRGADGNDELYGWGGNDTLVGEVGDDLLVGGDGDDFLSGDLQGGIAGFPGQYGGDDHLIGGSGNDSLFGGDGMDHLEGGAGDDLLIDVEAGSILDGGDGFDRTHFGGIGFVRPTATTPGLLIDMLDPSRSTGAAFGTRFESIEQLMGTIAADQIYGTNLSDVLSGSFGNDVIYGRDGADTLIGGDHDDILAGGMGADSLSGGVGIDTASYVESLGGVSIDLVSGTGQGYDAQGDTLSEIERIIGSSFGDMLMGDDWTNTLEGGDGDDVVSGAGGVDRLEGGRGNDNIIGGSAGDVLIGGAGNDFLEGGAGNDGLMSDFGRNLLWGGDGDDALYDGYGAEQIDGGVGEDTLVLRGSINDHFVMREGDAWRVTGQMSSDLVKGVEKVLVGGALLPWSDFAAQAFDGLRYIASSPDLIAALGADAAAGRQHYQNYSGLESRPLTVFDPLRYGASHPDLMAAFGMNTQALTYHYVQYGHTEGRTMTFDPLRYGASNLDVLASLGPDPQALLFHYYQYGHQEGRSAVSFDPLRYAAANPDLAQAFGTDHSALLNHYLLYGALIEHRSASFDEVGYLLSNPDLAAAGLSPRQALEHWLQFGMLVEGRSGDAQFGHDQESHAFDIGEPGVDGVLEKGGDRDWYEVTLAAGQKLAIELNGQGRGLGSLSDPQLSIFNSHGQLVASDADSGPGLDASLVFTANANDIYYIVAAGNDDFGAGSYHLAAIDFLL